MGGLRLGEITTPLLDQFIGTVVRQVRPPTARTCRTCVSGALGLAVRYGALTANPVREVDRIEGRSKREPRALTAAERAEWMARLLADEVAVRKDVPDLCQFLLAASARIGEALAVIWSDVDFGNSTVSITSTIIRVKGVGLIRKDTKSNAGQRVLVLPSWAMTMLQRRFTEDPSLDEPVFPDALGGFRDPNNTRRDLRNARGSDGFAWVTSHHFRKTAATILDDAGLSSRVIADQLGHSRPSLTQDVYMGRKQGSALPAAALERAWDSRVEGVKHG